MKFRKYMTGESTGWLLKIVVIPPVEQPGWTRVGTYHSHPRGNAGA